MIVIPINEANKLAYSKLFTELKTDLIAKGVEVNEITDIDSYFAHMGDIFQHLIPHKGKYVMLPIDEEPLEINLNTRAIKVPSLAAKCASVQGDHRAEILTFVVDRYFDYMDLDTTEIYIQYTLPNGEPGVSYIELKDIETLPGKIRFGWPLVEKITNQFGKVKFSVRFIKKATDAVTGKETIPYSLNTLTSEITIANALIPEFSAVEQDVSFSEDLFKNAISNSVNDSGVLPLVPTFGAPGHNLNTKAALTNDTLTLRAQAAKADNNILSYVWYYKNAEDTEFMALDPSETKVYEIKTSDFQLTSDTKRIPNKDYYYSDGELYVETELPNDDTPIYERFTTLTIVPGEAEVVGEYKVKALNTKAVSENKKYEQSIDSNICTLPAPAKIQITKDLDNIAWLGNKPIVLGIQTTEDKNAVSTKYVWTKQTKRIEEPQVYSTDAKISPTEPGWYKVTKSSTLNRKTESVDSNEIKVMNDQLVAPSIVMIDSDNSGDDVFKGSQITFTAIASLDSQTDLDTELYSQKLLYKWYFAVQDEFNTEITTANIKDNKIFKVIKGSEQTDIEAVNSDILKIEWTTDKNTKVYSFYCEVSNLLEDKQSEATISNSIILV